jgi:hypothetical protein
MNEIPQRQRKKENPPRKKKNDEFFLPLFFLSFIAFGLLFFLPSPQTSSNFFSLAACHTEHPDIFVVEQNIIKFSAKKRKTNKTESDFY